MLFSTWLLIVKEQTFKIFFYSMWHLLITRSLNNYNEYISVANVAIQISIFKIMYQICRNNFFVSVSQLYINYPVPL